jgi:hypothetical protein
MNNTPSPTSIQAGGVSDPPIRRSPRLENRRLLLGDGASSPAPDPPDPTWPQGSGGGVAQGGVRGTAAHAGHVLGGGRGGPAQPGRIGPGAPAPPGRGAPAPPGRGGAAQLGRGGAAQPGRGGAAQPGRGGAAQPGRGGRAAPAGRGARGSGRRFNTDELECLNEAIYEVLPIGPSDWERVADLHAQRYPDHNRCSANLRRKFKEMYSTQASTGDPRCPEHIRTAKHLHRAIQNRSDADNLEENEVDLGFEEEKNEEEINNDEGEGDRQPDAIARQLFQAPAARPLVRTPGSGGRSTRNGGAADLTAVVMASIAASNRNEQAEREERRQDRRMNQMLMIAMLSAMNPAAAGTMQPLQNNLVRQMQNDLMNQEPDDSSISTDRNN